jgi:hypothetical protein
MISCVQDMAALLSDIFNYDRSSAKLLKPVNMKSWLAPQYMFLDGNGYGHPWEIVKVGAWLVRCRDRGSRGVITP